MWGGDSDGLHDAPRIPSEGTFNLERKNNDESVPDATPRWQFGFFVGYSAMNFNQQYAIFVHGIQNDQRRLLEAGQHSLLYSTLRPLGGGPRFSVGLPYWFETINEIIGVAPDKAPILQITSHCDSIVVLRADEVNPNPVVRCTLRGVKGRQIVCHPTETHGLVFLEDPEFHIFKDQLPVWVGGDFLLQIHGGTKNFRPSPHLVSGGMRATLSLGNASKVITTGSPPDFLFERL